jgi:hypothetical protein
MAAAFQNAPAVVDVGVQPALGVVAGGVGPVGASASGPPPQTQSRASVRRCVTSCRRLRARRCEKEERVPPVLPGRGKAAAAAAAHVTARPVTGAHVRRGVWFPAREMPLRGGEGELDGVHDFSGVPRLSRCFGRRRLPPPLVSSRLARRPALRASCAPCARRNVAAVVRRAHIVEVPSAVCRARRPSHSSILHLRRLRARAPSQRGRPIRTGAGSTGRRRRRRPGA